MPERNPADVVRMLSDENVEIVDVQPLPEGHAWHVSVVGHDDLPTSELLDPPLATIRLDGQEMGRALMARLLGDGGSGDYVAPVELVERTSLQAPQVPVNPLFTPLSAATR